MKVKSFSYFKEKENVTKDYTLVVIKEDDNYMEGIDIKTLPEEKQKEVKDIFLEFEKKLEPFMTNYRKFKKSAVRKMEE